MVDPEMPTQQLLLHFGELTRDEILLVRAALRFANSQNQRKTNVERTSKKPSD